MEGRTALPDFAAHKRCGALLGGFLILAVALAACGRPEETTDDILVEWTLAPTTPAVNDPAMGRVTLLDRTNSVPVRGATLRFEAHMSHPGMVPVIEAATEQEPGVYTAGITLTMGGAWTVTLTGTLPDGRSIRRRVAEVTARSAH